MADTNTQATSKRKPWNAGRGIRCPSSLAATYVPQRYAKTELMSLINSMSDSDRVKLEISLAKDLIDLFPTGPITKRVKTWFVLCSDAMLKCKRVTYTPNGVALGDPDPHDAAVEMLMLLAQLHARGAIRIADFAGEKDKALADAILEDLADLADNMPSCRGRTH